MKEMDASKSQTWRHSKTKKQDEKSLINVNQGDTEVPESEKEVPIGERVKFWQEQDKINHALIPRVLQTHDKVCELSKRLDKQSSRVGRMVYNTIKSDLSKGLRKYESRLKELNSRCEQLEQRVIQLEAKLTSEATARDSNQSSKRISWMALGLAGLALLISLFNFFG